MLASKTNDKVSKQTSGKMGDFTLQSSPLLIVLKWNKWSSTSSPSSGTSVNKEIYRSCVSVQTFPITLAIFLNLNRWYSELFILVFSLTMLVPSHIKGNVFNGRTEPIIFPDIASHCPNSCRPKQIQIKC